MQLGKFETDNVYNVDCYKAIKDIPDKSIDCIYTDIPYLYNNGGGGSETNFLTNNTKRLKNSLIGIDAGIDYSILDDFVRIMKKVNIFIWCSKMQLLYIMNYFEKYNCSFEILVWCKTNPTPMCNQKWLSDIEYCLWFKEKGVLLNDGYELKSKYFISEKNVRDKDKFAHPTIKPIELVKRHLLHTTQPNDIVLDCFMGSGTTCVACKDIGRRYIGFEIEKKWYDIAVNRLNKVDANGQMGFLLS